MSRTVGNVGIGVVALLSAATLVACFLILQRLSGMDARQEGKLQMVKQDFAGHIYTSCSFDGTTIALPPFTSYLGAHGLEDEYVLVVKYSDFSCASCMDYLLSKLERYIPDYRTNPRVLFMGSDFKTKARKEYGNTILLKGSESLDSILDGTNIPYVFVYRGCVLMSFSPSSALDEVADTYFETVSERFFK